MTKALTQSAPGPFQLTKKYGTKETHGPLPPQHKQFITLRRHGQALDGAITHFHTMGRREILQQ